MTMEGEENLGKVYIYESRVRSFRSCYLMRNILEAISKFVNEPYRERPAQNLLRKVGLQSTDLC